jgi:hypothetical protein
MIALDPQPVFTASADPVVAAFYKCMIMNAQAVVIGAEIARHRPIISPDCPAPQGQDDTARFRGATDSHFSLQPGIFWLYPRDSTAHLMIQGQYPTFVL